METGQVIQSWVALLIILSALGAFLGYANRNALQRQTAKVQQRLIPPGVAYRNYLSVWIAMRFIFAFLAVVSMIIGFFVVSNASVTADDVFPPALRLFFVGLPLIFWIALAVFGLVAEGAATADAIKLVGVTATRGQALAFRWKSLLLSLLLWAPLEAAIIIAVAGVPLWWLLIPVLALLLASLVISTSRFRIMYPSQPLEQTEWAPLAPRIQEWARLAKFPYKGTRITRSDSFGFRDGNVSGLFKRTLYLSDGLLRNTDWRQQDAFIAYLFAFSRRRRLIYATSLGFGLPVLAIMLGLLYFQLTNPASVLTSLLLPLIIVLLFFIALVVRIVLRVYLTTGDNRLPFYSDRMAAKLTGDPMAVMVVLNTINQITGGMMGSVNLFGANSGGALMQQRMVRLDALLRQPGPRAPWVYQPVPSMTPVFFGPFSLTVPYQPSTPGPVPQTRYPDAPAPMSPMPSMPGMPNAPQMPPNMPPMPMQPVMTQPPMMPPMPPNQ